MPVLAYADQSTTLDVGDVWQLRVLVLDDDQLPAATAVTVAVTDPEGTTSAPAATAEDTGVYAASVTLAVPGRHLAVVSASGAVVGVVPFTVWAATASPASDYPDAAEVMAYLGDTSATEAEVADALAAETAAQRSRCRIPPVYPDDLRQALKRRVARNLAARGVPIAQFTSFEGGGTASRVPTKDAEISRLEGPFRKHRVG